MKLNEFDFRVWDNIEKKYCKSPHGLYIENTDNNSADNCRRIIENYEQLGFSVDHPYNCGNNEYFVNENAFSIELWTGLYDKNGKKIYENDILYSFEDCPEGEAFKYKVVLKEGAFYLVECGDNGEEYDEDLISEFQLTELEIIGNIHENPELLKCFYKNYMLIFKDIKAELIILKNMQEKEVFKKEIFIEKSTGNFHIHDNILKEKFLELQVVIKNNIKKDLNAKS